jgi:hypothetical protein
MADDAVPVGEDAVHGDVRAPAVLGDQSVQGRVEGLRVAIIGMRT